MLWMKQQELKDLFSKCRTAEEKYQKVIELGRALPPFDPRERVPENLVHGCQSTMYLHTRFEDGLLIFNAESDALISKGLAAILIALYSNEPPSTLLQQPPTVLSEIGLFQLLTPGRSNGLLSLHLHMKQKVLMIEALDESRGGNDPQHLERLF